jgi:SAM-dependent methyltransferase
VYDYLRPLAVGGVDFSPLYARIEAADSVILDVGCGTGDALKHLSSFAMYLGLDTDEAAVAVARRRYQKENVRFQVKECGAEDVAQLQPTHVVLAGLLHHLDDKSVQSLLSALQDSGRLVRVLTVDIVYLPGEKLNNFFARRDRGRHCRDLSGYRELVRQSGFTLSEERVLRSHPRTGLVKYLYMTLTPKAP